MGESLLELMKDQLSFGDGLTCNYDLVCQACRRIENIEATFTRLYTAINELGWALIPSCHGRLVKGICPQCRERDNIDA
jgi:hypothetical protein